MKRLRFSVWEQSTQRYDTILDEEGFADYIKWLHERAEDKEGYNYNFAVEACKVFDTLTFDDIVAIMTEEKDDIEFPSGWHDYNTSVQECLYDWVHEFIYDDCPEYLDSEEIDNGVEIVDD